MAWTVLDLTLKELAAWGAAESSRESIRNPTVFRARLPDSELVLALVVSPQSKFFQAVLGDYPQYVESYAATVLNVWNDRYGNPADALLLGLKSAKLDIKTFPRLVTVPPDAVSLKHLGSKSKFRYSAFAIAPFLLPQEALDGFEAYLAAQLDQFQSRSFFTSDRTPQPIQWQIALGEAQLDSCENSDLILALGLPQDRLTDGLLERARKVLEHLLTSTEESGLEKIYRPRPMFARSGVTRRLVITNAPTISWGLEDEVNLLRARWLTKLSWPDFYGEVTIFMRTHRDSWSALQNKSKSMEAMWEELEEYLRSVERLYPIVLANPFEG